MWIIFVFLYINLKFKLCFIILPALNFVFIKLILKKLLDYVSIFNRYLHKNKKISSNLILYNLVKDSAWWLNLSEFDPVKTQLLFYYFVIIILFKEISLAFLEKSWLIRIPFKIIVGFQKQNVKKRRQTIDLNISNPRYNR